MDKDGKIIIVVLDHFFTTPAMMPEMTPNTTNMMTSIQTMQQHSRRLLCYRERDSSEGDSLLYITWLLPVVPLPCLTEHDLLRSSVGCTQHVVQ